MQLNVPFLPDPDYVKYLAGLGERLYAVHFGLGHPALSDARVRLQAVDSRRLEALLKTLDGPRKYLLANGRFHPPGRYRSPGGWTEPLESMQRMLAAGVLDGIVFSDPYLLRSLSDASPETAARLEAVPSVNFMIDTLPRLDALLEAVAGTGFRPPGKITLDRSLNRRPAKLAEVAAGVRRRLPRAKIELLANEGCLRHCPFRSSHEALIAAANAGLGADTFRLNRDLGCMRVLAGEPHRIFASPFIRPEDLHRYETVADIVKVCGRTLGAGFLRRTVGAYAAGAFAGNLAELLDAARWMAERWQIPNGSLPEDFFEIVTGCDRDCGTCTTCRELFRRSARPRPIRIENLRGR